MSLNVISEHVHYNDIVPYVSNMFEELKGGHAEESFNKVKEIVVKYGLSKTNREGFNQLREDYNNGKKEWCMFYALMCFSFNNQYRFNNNQEYNSSFGKHKCCFSDVTKKKFINFMNRLNDIDISFDCKDFRTVDLSCASENDLVYFDPPYLISCGNYNDGKRGFNGWNKQDDLDLMEICDELNNQGTRFAMSNVLENKGLKNEELINWSEKYKVYTLNNNYGNSNYQKKDKSKNSTLEVLITNY